MHAIAVAPGKKPPAKNASSAVSRPGAASHTILVRRGLEVGDAVSEGIQLLDWEATDAGVKAPTPQGSGPGYSSRGGWNA